MAEKIKCAIIGSGRWAKILQQNVKLNSKLLVVYSEDHAKNLSQYAKIFSRIRPSITFIATDPKNQMAVLQEISTFSTVIVIEKPIVIDEDGLIELKQIVALKQNSILADLTLCFHHSKSLIIDSFNREDLKSVQIWDGNSGPKRSGLPPCFDWLPHSISLTQLSSPPLLLEAHRVNYNDNRSNYIVLSSGGINGFDVKIISGNSFLFKNRKIKFEFLEKKYVQVDFALSDPEANSPISNLIEASISKLIFKQAHSYTQAVTDDMFVLENATKTINLCNSFSEFT